MKKLFKVMMTFFITLSTVNIYNADIEAVPDDIKIKSESIEHGKIIIDKENANAGDLINLSLEIDRGYKLVAGSLKYKQVGGVDKWTVINNNQFLVPELNTKIEKSVTNTELYLTANQEYNIVAQGGGGKGGHGVSAKVKYTEDTSLVTKVINNSAWVYDQAPDTTFKSLADRQAVLLVGSAGSGNSRGNDGGQYGASQSANGYGYSSEKGSVGWYDGGGLKNTYCPSEYEQIRCDSDLGIVGDNCWVVGCDHWAYSITHGAGSSFIASRTSNISTNNTVGYNTSNAYISISTVLASKEIIVTAEFEALPEIEMYDSSLNGGEITFDKNIYYEKDVVKIKITPETGMKLKDNTFKVRNIIRNADNSIKEYTAWQLMGNNTLLTFEVLGANDFEFYAEFEEVKYSINILDNTNGTATYTNLTSSANNYKDKIKLIITPNEGKKIEKVTYFNTNDRSEFQLAEFDTTLDYYHFEMPDYDINIEVEYANIIYNIQNEILEDGKVISDQTDNESTFGKLVTLDVENIKEGYELDYFKYKKISDTDWINLLNNNSSFTMPSSNIIISAAFKESIYSIGKDSTIINGNIGFNTNEANFKDNVSITIKPKRGYLLKPNSLKYYNILKDEWTPISNFTFVMPSSSIYVYAEFEIDPDYIQSDYANVDIESVNGWIDYSINNENDTTKIELSDYPFIGYKLKEYTWRNKEDLVFKKLNGNTIEIKSQDNVLKFTSNNTLQLLANKDYTILAQGGGGLGGHGVSANVNYSNDTTLTFKIINNSAWVYDKKPDTSFKSLADRQAVLLVGAAGSGNSRGNDRKTVYDALLTTNGQGSEKGSTGWYDGGGWSDYLQETCTNSRCETICKDKTCSYTTCQSDYDAPPTITCVPLSNGGESCHYEYPQKCWNVEYPCRICEEDCNTYSYDCSTGTRNYGAGSSYINTANTSIEDYDENMGYSNNAYIEVTRYFNDIDVKAEFEMEDYTLQIKELENGVISIPSTAKYGDKITVMISPNVGYKMPEMFYYIKKGTNEKYYFLGNSFLMPSFDIEFDYSFEEFTYDIDTSNIENGVIEKKITHKGNYDQIEFVVKPNIGYHFSKNSLSWKNKNETDENWKTITDELFSIDNYKINNQTNYLYTDKDILNNFTLKANTKYRLNLLGGGQTVSSGDLISVEVLFAEDTDISFKNNEIRLGKAEIEDEFKVLPLFVLSADGFDLNNKAGYPEAEGMYGATAENHGLNYSDINYGGLGYFNGGCSLQPVNGSIICGGGSSYIADNSSIIKIEHLDNFNGGTTSAIQIIEFANIDIEIKADFEATDYSVEYVGFDISDSNYNDIADYGLTFSQDNELHINDVIKLKQYQADNQEYSIVLGSIEYRLKTYPEDIYGKIDESSPTYGEWTNLGIYKWDYTISNSDIEFRSKFITETKVDIINQDVRQAVIEKYLDYRLNEKTNKYFDVYGNDDNKFYLYTSEMAYLNTFQDLDLSNTGLKSTEGIDELIQALGSKTVNLSHNNIKEATIAIPSVEKLFLENNMLEKIDVSNLGNLVTLDVSNNNLEVIDITSNQNLTRLNADGNNISSFDFATNPNLIELTLTNNQIYAIDLDGNPNLVNVDLSNQNLYYMFPFDTKEFKLDIAKLFPKEVVILNLPNETNDIKKVNTTNEIYIADFDYNKLKEIIILGAEIDEGNEMIPTLYNRPNDLVNKVEIDGLNVTFKSKDNVRNVVYEYAVGNDILEVIINVSIKEKTEESNSSSLTDSILWYSYKGNDGIRISIIDTTNNSNKIIYVEDYSNNLRWDVECIDGIKSKLEYKLGDSVKLKCNVKYLNKQVSTLPTVVGGDQKKIIDWVSNDVNLSQIAQNANISYEELKSEKYKIAIEPIIYFEYDNQKYVGSATQIALWDAQTDDDKDGYGFVYKMARDLMHNILPKSIYPTTNQFGYSKVSFNSSYLSNKFITERMGINFVNFNEQGNNTATTLNNYSYRPNTEVYTSVYITSDVDKIAVLGNAAKVKMKSKYFNCEIDVEVPEGQTQLAWCKWTTPNVEDNEYYIDVYVDDIKLTSIKSSIGSIKYKNIPDTNADDKKPLGWRLKNIPDLQNPDIMSWSVWKAKFINNKWSFYDEKGIPIKLYYTVKLETTLKLSNDKNSPKNYGNYIKSGYGIEIKAENILIGNGEHTAIQTGIAVYPEFDYKNYGNFLEGEKIMTLKKNFASITNNRVHFTPIWYPNNIKYIVKIKVMDCWTPAGMLNTTTSDYKTVNGSVWDDIHVGKN